MYLQSRAFAPVDSLPNLSAKRTGNVFGASRCKTHRIKDLARISYEEFCASDYHDLFVELVRRGWTEKKLVKAYDSAIAAWQHDGFEGKPSLKLVLEAFLDGVVD